MELGWIFGWISVVAQYIRGVLLEMVDFGPKWSIFGLRLYSVRLGRCHQEGIGG